MQLISRTALDGLPFEAEEKDKFVKILKRFSCIYFAEVIGFCMMSNHFHLLVRIYPGENYSDSEIKKRYKAFYGDVTGFPCTEEGIQQIRDKWANLSGFIKEIKQTFSVFYNRKHSRRGTLWGERFKSLIVQNGESLVNCLAYIDLNPVRAKIVKRPEDYRWSSVNYHAQKGNRDGFLSTDFGMVEFGSAGADERFRQYRKFLYKKGEIGVSADKGEFRRFMKSEIKKTNLFLNKTRYFTDSGIIGNQEFVAEKYHLFKHLFSSKNDKKPKPVQGISGLYSMKRLSG